jgi:Spy/CpxP family protein refolding chaperone
MRFLHWLSLPLLMVTGVVPAETVSSPYAALATSDIKALSAQEQADLLDGKGMGFAKAAELNGYPGPKHVLELAGVLQLTAEQRSRTAELFERMQSAAKRHGAALVAAERALDELYASRQATLRRVNRHLAAIEAARTRVRAVHLQAHLDQAALLTPAQTSEYSRLRGYHGAQPHSPHVH